MTESPTTAEFRYRDGALSAEAVPLARIAEEVGTPFYCYSAGALQRAYRTLAAALDGLPATICYSLKANSNLAVVRTLAALGAGADVVSEGEARQALAAGIPAARIVFSGVGKTRDELAFALDSGIGQINVESADELELLGKLAAAGGAPVAVAVRVNPDVDARSHDKISTGRKEDKFGVDFTRAKEIYARARALAGVEPVGIAMHIGSQITDLAPYRAAFKRLAELVGALRAEGHDVARLDLGGGLGISYGDAAPPPSAADYAALVRKILAPLGCKLQFEPGRSIAGNAGVLVTRVLYTKPGESRSFVIVDAAMNDLKRPALYGAYHAIVPVAEPAADAAESPVDVVGPVCETGDTFATGRALPPVAAGDLLALCSAGAYGAVMSSSYNSRPLAAEVLVSGARFAVVRPRQTYEEMLGRDRIPDWLDEPAEGADLDGGDLDGAAAETPVPERGVA